MTGWDVEKCNTNYTSNNKRKGKKKTIKHNASNHGEITLCSSHL